MKKEKLVRKFLPVEPFDLRGLEEWFSAMAAQGLHLVKLNQDWACFRSGPARTGVRYALDVTDWADIDPERNEAYAQMGWDYVTTLSRLYYVYRSQDPNAPKLHTDPVTQSWTLNRLVRLRPWALIFGALLVLFLCRDSLAALLADPWSPLRFLLLRTEPALLWLVMTVSYLLLLIVPALRRRRALKALQKQLANGIPLDESRRWPRKIPHLAVEGGFLLLLAGILACSVVWSTQSVRALSGPEEWDFPYVTLEQALGDTPLDRLIPDFPYDPRLHPNTVRRSLLVPEQITWGQRGTAVFPNGTTAECGVSLHLFRLRFPDMASLLLRCIQEEERAGWRRYEKHSGELYLNPELEELLDFQPLDHPVFDQLSVLSWRTADMEAPRQFYAGRAGDRVFTLTCWGPANTELALELLAQQIAMEQEAVIS